MITFIIGTDTNVGKTYIGTQLAKKGHTVIKPIETGKNQFNDIYDSDSGKYAKIQNCKIDDINVYFFNKPMSPHIASKLDGIEINIELVKDFIKRHKEAYIELAGGLMVPLKDNYTQLDLIKSFPDSEVLLVLNNTLGAINHTLLTLEVLKANNIKIKDIIYNDIHPGTNTEVKENNIITIENLR